MNDSLNNKELVAVGHEFAKTLSSDTPIIDMAKIVSRLAERLDCTTSALREMTKQRDALAAKLETADKLHDSAFRHGLQHGFSLGQTDDEDAFKQSIEAYSPYGGVRINGEG